MIVFGGTATIPQACAIGGPIAFVNETWIYDDPCNRWTRIDGDAPSPSGRHMAAFGDGQMWVFGGRYRAPDAASGIYEIYDDLFRFDSGTRTWHGVTIEGERPSARVSGALAWDPKRGRLWLFGGNESADGAAYAPLNDLWSFDPGKGVWTEQSPTGERPSARVFHAMLYDPKRDTLVVYGGSDESAFTSAVYKADLYALSLDELSWTRLHPGDGDAPPGRFWAQLAYDYEDDGYLLFGGHDDQELGNRNDSWSFDPETRQWRSLEQGDTYNRPANDFCDFPPDFSIVDDQMPERRNAHTMVASEACGHVLLFGGKTDCGAIDDVWVWSGAGFAQRMEATEGEACVRWRETPEDCSDMCF